MTISSTRNVLVAFIASPGDVAEERRATREVIEELNKSLRKLNWQIDIIGWEDTSPGIGRPQQLINNDVDACDLFIGILWRRWGSPTGEHSSGFEEEFERALNRGKETGSPEIWLAFKQIDPEFLKDIGDQLRQVLAFRQKQNEQRQVLYQEFTNVEEWKALLRTWLLEYIFKQVSALQQSPEDVSNAATAVPDAESSQAPSLTTDANVLPAHEQVLGVINSIKDAAEGADSDDFALGTDKLDPFEVVRHLLLSTALMSVQIQSTMLDVHDAQRLYLYRQRLEPLQVERMLLFRMLINDDDGLIPGWYWFSWLSEEMLRGVLFDFAFRDRNINVRMRARELLAAARIPPPEDTTKRDTYLKFIAADESALVRKAGMSYLGVVGDKRDLPTIKSGLDDPSIGSEATIARLLVLARSNSVQVLTESIPKYLPKKRRVISELKANAENIRKEALLVALKSKDSDEDVKFIAIKELQRRNELTNDIASSLLEDSSGRVAELCYMRLIDQGEKFSPTDIYIKVGDDTYNRQHGSDYFFRDPPYANARAVILEMYKSYTESALWELVDWQQDIDLGDVAYKALALYYFNEVSSRIRDDLTQEFKSYEGPYLEAATAKWTKWDEEEKKQPLSMRGFGLLTSAWRRSQGEKERTPEDSAKSETEGIKSKYIAAALAGIAQNGEADDIIFGRKYLLRDDYDVRVEAIKLIERFGDEDDIQALIDVAKTTEGILQESAARVALKLSPDVKETARVLLLTAKEDLVSLVVSYLAEVQDLAAMSEFLEPLLLEKSDIVRRKVVAFFAKKFTEKALEDLLVRYISQATYYYDVVCWIDRILYAPAQLKIMFVRQLETEFHGQ